MPAAQTPLSPGARRESTPPPPSAERCESGVPSSVVRLAAAAGVGALLVVDDDVHVRRVARRVLAHAGFTVIDVASGEEAVATAAVHGASLAGAVVDVTMPGIDGPTCVATLRRMLPGLPVLFCSGYTADGVLAQPDDRATGFLAKPYHQRELVERVAALLALGP
jgi:CheY-like chemotaxis protein